MYYSVEAEKSIVGTVLYQPDIYSNFVGVLYPEDFYDPQTRKIFLAQQSLYDKGLDINVISVINELQSQKITDVSDSYIRELMDSYRVDEEAVMSFANQISEFAGIRLTIAELGNISGVLHSNNEAVELPEIINKLERLTERLGGKAYKANEYFGEALTEDFFAALDLNEAGAPFLAIPQIDELLVDVNPGELIVFGARPGVGKTAAMLQVARVMMEQGKRVGFVTREMRPNKLLSRLIAAKSGVSGTEIAKMKAVDAMNDPRIVAAAEYYAQDNKIIIDAADPGDIDSVVKSIRKMVRVHKCDVVFIDYLQLITGNSRRKNDNRQQEVADISRTLKILSNNLSIPIITASQLSREAVKSVSQRPTLAHLRESGAIEQDASIVIFLYPIFADTLTEEQREAALKEAEVIAVMIEIAKQRNGPVDRHACMFKRSVGVFANQGFVNDTTYSETQLPFNH